MADRDEKIMQMVERRVRKNPDVTSKELYEKAVEMNSDIGKLSVRQFHARYPLQVKRKRARDSEKKAKRGTRSAKKKAPGVDRQAIRKVLLSLTRDMANAEKGDVVDIVAGIDKYVDEVVKAVGK